MRSLRGQLTWRLLAGGAFLLGAAGVGLHWQSNRALTDEFDAGLRATAQSLAALTEQNEGRPRMEFAGGSMPAFESANGDEVFLMRTPEGREIERSHSLGSHTLPMRAGSPGMPAFFEERLPDGRMLRCAGIGFIPPAENDERSSKPVEVVLVVGRDRAQLDHTLGTLSAALSFVGIFALAALTVLVRWGVRSALVPLDRLGESVAVMDVASLATRFPIESLPAELRPIALRLNELFARLESAFARERRFTASVSHELRTPLSELRVLAEVNLTTPATEAERADSWRDALATTRRMESLSLRLLELTRAEDPERVLLREPVALGEALAAAWQPWAGRAAMRGIELVVIIPPGLCVQTDRALLGVILGNLCSNASEHAPADSPLRVTGAASGAGVSLIFQNRAGNLTEADIPHLFERFWRKDTARTDARHHGLGLALAAEFTALLGGTLTAGVVTGDIDFVLSLPTA